MNILLVGSGAREHAIARAIKKSSIFNKLFCFASNRNPGIEEFASILEIGEISNPRTVLKFSSKHSIDLAVIGPEAPLANGVVDALLNIKIQCVGPTKDLAQIETSKSFTRELMQKHNITGCHDYGTFNSTSTASEILKTLSENYEVKFDGKIDCKAVKVGGDHVYSHSKELGDFGGMVQ